MVIIFAQKTLTLRTFAHVSFDEGNYIGLTMAAQIWWDIHQMDVKSAFLNGILEEEVPMEQPQGFVQKEKEHLVYKWKKALYGLNWAVRATVFRSSASNTNI